MIPVLETERLILRGPKIEDFEAEAAFFATERSAHVGGPLDRIDAWTNFTARAGHWTIRGYGFWSLEERATGRYLGRVGLFYPEGWPEEELGWTMMADGEGRGLAFEAALAARRYAYRELAWPTVMSLIKPENARSIALAERLGARFETHFEHARYGRMAIYRHPSPAELAATEEAA